MGVIYKIMNNINGKIYIGKTSRALKFITQGHKDFSKNEKNTTYLALAIRKYGFENFTFSEIEIVDNGVLNQQEIFWIHYYQSNNRLIGYNMSIGGDGGNNSMSPEVRAKISKSKSGVKSQPMAKETKEKISKANKGKKRTPEQIEKITQSRVYGPLSEVHRLKIKTAMNKNKKFKLSEKDRESINELILIEKSDEKISKIFNVSRKMIWRMRKKSYI